MKMKRLVVLFLVVCMLAAILGGCKKQDKSPTTTQTEDVAEATGTLEESVNPETYAIDSTQTPSTENTEPATVPTTSTTPTTTPTVPTQCSHTYKDATCTNPKTCTKCNATEGNAAGHNWANATCTAPKTCTKCNATEGKAAHSWINATCAAPKICSKCGTTEGDLGSHNYQEGTCTVCGCKRLGYGRWRAFYAEGETLYLITVVFSNTAGEKKVGLTECSAESYFSPEEIADMIAFGYSTIDYQGQKYFLEAGQSQPCHYKISGDSVTVYLGGEGEGLPDKMTLKLSGKDQATATSVTGFDFNNLFGFQGVTENMVFTCLD